MFYNRPGPRSAQSKRWRWSAYTNNWQTQLHDCSFQIKMTSASVWLSPKLLHIKRIAVIAAAEGEYWVDQPPHETTPKEYKYPTLEPSPWGWFSGSETGKRGTILYVFYLLGHSVWLFFWLEIFLNMYERRLHDHPQKSRDRLHHHCGHTKSHSVPSAPVSTESVPLWKGIIFLIE